MKFLALYISLFILNNSESKQFFSSKAFELETNKKLYSEQHQLMKLDEINTLWKTNYIDIDGTIISFREIKIESDSLRPDFVFSDLRTGYKEGAEKLGSDQIRIFRQLDENSELESDTLNIDENYVVDAGLTALFRKNWDALLDDETIKFKFVVPSKLDYFSFRVSKNRIYRYNNVELVELLLEPSSFIIRQFVDPILISYEKKTKHIARYEGLSNVNDLNGKSLNVVIDYISERGN